MYAAATPISVAGPAARRGRHRRRPVDVGQHLHHGRDRGRRRRRPRGQARQPVGVLGSRAPPTSSRRSASGSTCRADRVAELAATRPASPSASPPPSTPRCGTPPSRGASSASARPSTSSARSPTRPGPAAQAIGCADPRMAPVMAGVFARRGVDAWVVPRRRRARRAHHHHDLVGVAGPRRRGREASASTRRARHRARPRPRRCAAATPTTTPRSYAACSTASSGPCATPCCSTPGRRSPSTTRRGAACVEALAAGIDEGRARPSTRAPPRRPLDRWVAASAA